MATSLVSSFLIPLLKKGAESLGTELGERTTQSVADGLVGTAQRLWDRVKGSLQSRDDQDIAAIFERQPKVMQEALEKLVLRKLEQDEGFRREVAQLLEAEAEPGVASWKLMGEIVGAVDARHQEPGVDSCLTHPSVAKRPGRHCSPGWRCARLRSSLSLARRAVGVPTSSPGSARPPREWATGRSAAT